MKLIRLVLELLKAATIIVGITVILAASLFIGGEYWARKNAAQKAQSGEQAIHAANQTFAYHPWAGFRNTPGFEYPQNSNFKIVKINKYGWRGPEPKIDRPKNVKRALLLGESVPFSGWGCKA